MIGIACSTDTIWSVNAFGATSTNLAARELPLTRRSSQADSCVTRVLAAFHFQRLLNRRVIRQHSAADLAQRNARTRRVDPGIPELSARMIEVKAK